MWKSILGGTDNSRIFVFTTRRGDRRTEHQYNDNDKEHPIYDTTIHRTCMGMWLTIIPHHNVNQITMKTLLNTSIDELLRDLYEASLIKTT